jgi:signal transduction histidine kinase
MNQHLIEELKNVVGFRDLPDEHLEWIIAHSEYYEHEDGHIIFKTGEPIDVMWILLEGKVNFYMDINGRLVYYFCFENNEITGGVGGLLPYSRLKSSPGFSIAVGKVRGLMIHKKYFHELELLNPDLIQRLIGYMTARARIFATTQLQHEKVSALGKLAAGIAHELNNPASAISRISAELKKKITLSYKLTEEMLNQNINPKLIRNIYKIVQNQMAEYPGKTKISPLKRIQREDELSEWLNKNILSFRPEMAETFTEAGLSTENLADIHREAGNESIQKVLDWLENLLSAGQITKDLEDASERITKLVRAIKTHVHMDRSNDLHHTDIHNDLDNTLTLLGYKIREKDIRVDKIYCEEMPEVEAYVAELNQVWTNIIDNAVYALPRGGKLTIATTCDSKDVTIRIIDNGPGIPQNIISRIFDPFFTTKKMGEGTGIGLDIAQRVINDHSGKIKVNSHPGNTEFIISLPVSQNSLKVNAKNETSIHYNS